MWIKFLQKVYYIVLIFIQTNYAHKNFWQIFPFETIYTKFEKLEISQQIW